MSPPGVETNASFLGPRSALGLWAVMGSVAMWGYSAVAIKTVSTTGPVTAFYRLWFAIPLLWAVVLAFPRMRSSLSRDWLLGSMAGGILFATHQLLFFTAVKFTTIANVTIIGALQPVLVLLVAAPLFSESTSSRAILASLVAIGGTSVVIGGASGSVMGGGFGDVLAVGNLFAFTGYFLLSKRIRYTVGAPEYVAGMTTMAGLVMGLACLVLGEDLLSPTASDLWMIAALAVFPGALGHVLTNWAHAYVSALRISMILLAAPVVATASAAFFLGETLQDLQMVGFGLVLGAIAVALLETGSGQKNPSEQAAAETNRPDF